MNHVAARRLKLCLITETYYPVVGGGETQARLLAAGLVDAGSSVIVLTRRSDATLAPVEQYGDVTVHRLPPTGQGQLKKWGLLLSIIPRLIRLRSRYDLIFVSGFRTVGVTAVLISKLFGKACVLKADSRGEMSGAFFRAGLARLRMAPDSFLFRIFLAIRNRILIRADAFSAISDDIAGELRAAGINPKMIHRIPNSVDTSLFSPVSEGEKRSLREKLNLPASARIAIYTGRLVSYKGLPLLLRVWHKLQQSHGDLLLLLVGEGGLDMHNCEAELRAYTSQHDLEACVRFTGSVTNVQEYLQAADVFVFPTEDDAFPSSLVEAMSCRLPVIATPVGAIGTIIADGKNGILVEPRASDELYEALDTLLADERLADSLGKAGRATVERRYSSTAVNQRYFDLFCSIVDCGNAPRSEKWS